MGGLELAILVAVVVALSLFVLYLSASRREQGQDPFYAREVYLYRPVAGSILDGGAASRAAAQLGATVATEGQIVVYAAAGGEAPGCGLVAEGRALTLLVPVGVTADGCNPAECGVWLYGPKPRRLYPGVAPFNGARWFQ